MKPLPAIIGKAKIDEFNVVIFDHLKNSRSVIYFNHEILRIDAQTDSADSYKIKSTVAALSKHLEKLIGKRDVISWGRDYLKNYKVESRLISSVMILLTLPNWSAINKFPLSSISEKIPLTPFESVIFSPSL